MASGNDSLCLSDNVSGINVSRDHSWSRTCVKDPVVSRDVCRGSSACSVSWDSSAMQEMCAAQSAMCSSALSTVLHLFATASRVLASILSSLLLRRFLILLVRVQGSAQRMCLLCN